jgi:hypothetical protein
MRIIDGINEIHLFAWLRKISLILIVITFFTYGPSFAVALEQQEQQSALTMIESPHHFSLRGHHRLNGETIRQSSSDNGTIFAGSNNLSGKTIRQSSSDNGTIFAGSGDGSLIYSAHRAPGNWDNCFAISCRAGKGPGVTMFFVVYDSSHKEIASGQADENGVLIKGLELGSTYYIVPQNCINCNHSPHDVLFDHWEDCSTNPQRGFTIDSQDQVPTAAAYYRIWWYGNTDVHASCTSPDGSSMG